jgi:hypothetical protein
MRPAEIAWNDDEPGLERRLYRDGSLELFVWCRYYASGSSLENSFPLHHGAQEWTRVTVEGFALHCDVDTAGEWAFVWTKGTTTLHRIETEADLRTMVDVVTAMPVLELHEAFLTWSAELEEPIRKAVLLRLSEAVKQFG